MYILDRLTSRMRGTQPKPHAFESSNPPCKRSQGFTLIELMVGITLLAILMVGFVPVFAQGLAQSSSARFKSVATNIAREKIEQIRQLDYREIQEYKGAPYDAGDPDDPKNLSKRFGDSVTIVERDMTFTIDYDVDEEFVDQAIKSVQVTVTWTAPPAPMSPAVLKTMVAQQYLGPRAASLVISPESADTEAPGGTPFPMLAVNDVNTTVKYYLAESDWFMAYDSLTLPLTSPNDIKLLTYFADDAGGQLERLVLDNTYLHNSTTASPPIVVEDIWFEYSFDARDIPDGYWDFKVVMLNTFDEPGNTWTRRVRVEKGPPEPPTNFVATAVTDVVVSLSWTPGAERDRVRYVLERVETDEDRQPLAGHDWEKVSVDPTLSGSLPTNTLPPYTAAFTDMGSLDPDIPPCGSAPDAPRYYLYRVYGVDTGERFATDMAPMAFVELPPATSILPIQVPDVRNILVDNAKVQLNDIGLGWSATEDVDDSVAEGTVLAQSPTPGTWVPAGTIVNLTVAIPAEPEAVPFTVTIKKDDNPGQTIVVVDLSYTPYFSGTLKKNDPVTVSLINGNYSIRENIPTGPWVKDFTVNGGPITVTIP